MSSWVDKYASRAADLTKQVEAGNSGVSNAKIDELDARLDRAWDAVFAGAKACEAETKPSIEQLDSMFGS